MSEALYDAEALAARLLMRPSRVMELNRTEGWPHVRIGRRIRWTEQQVAEIVRSHTVTPDRAVIDALPAGLTTRSKARRSA